ncbi:MAG TPA: hypothetical protein VK607_19585, partial [Kofleriaceae bacterium]|nr:hypothetical protein [Kofleriaceae bacterium]
MEGEREQATIAPITVMRRSSMAGRSTARAACPDGTMAGVSSVVSMASRGFAPRAAVSGREREDVEHALVRVVGPPAEQALHV